MAAEGGWVRTQKRKKLMNKGNNRISLFAVIVTVFKGTVTVISSITNHANMAMPDSQRYP